MVVHSSIANEQRKMFRLLLSSIKNPFCLCDRERSVSLSLSRSLFYVLLMCLRRRRSAYLSSLLCVFFLHFILSFPMQFQCPVMACSGRTDTLILFFNWQSRNAIEFPMIMNNPECVCLWLCVCVLHVCVVYFVCTLKYERRCA